MTTNMFASWIGTGLLLFDAWVIHRKENFLCLFTEGYHLCKSFERSPVAFSVAAVLVALLAIAIFVLPFIPAVRAQFREAMEEHGEEIGQGPFMQTWLDAMKRPLGVSLLAFVSALALVTLMLLQLWGYIPQG